MSSRSRIPYEEAEVLGMAERLFRLGLDSEDTERERGELVLAIVDMALAKLISAGADWRSAAVYRSEDCRGECMLRACTALSKARTEDGRQLVNFVVKAVQNRARTLCNQDVRYSQSTDVLPDFDGFVAPDEFDIV